jgi:Response regulator receiver domain
MPIGKSLVGYVGLPKLFTVFAVSYRLNLSYRLNFRVLCRKAPPFVRTPWVTFPSRVHQFLPLVLGVHSMTKRVLIVDDSPSLRKMVFILFTSNGYSICGEAENGAQAIERARETRPDIIVLDYSMPVMDGIRAAKSRNN